MGHVMSHCTCEKMAGVDPELVALALARLRDQHGRVAAFDAVCVRHVQFHPCFTHCRLCIFHIVNSSHDF